MLIVVMSICWMEMEIVNTLHLMERWRMIYDPFKTNKKYDQIHNLTKMRLKEYQEVTTQKPSEVDSDALINKFVTATNITHEVRYLYLKLLTI